MIAITIFFQISGAHENIAVCMGSVQTYCAVPRAVHRADPIIVQKILIILFQTYSFLAVTDSVHCM